MNPLLKKVPHSVLAHKYRAECDRYILNVTTTRGFVEPLNQMLSRSEAVSLIWQVNGEMSALGVKRTFSQLTSMSVIDPKRTSVRLQDLLFTALQRQQRVEGIEWVEPYLRAAKAIYRAERLLKSCRYFSGSSWPQLSTNR